MNTLRSISNTLGVSRRRLLGAVHRLGFTKTGRDFVLDDKQAAMVFHELGVGRGHPSIYDQARRRLYRVFGGDRDAVTLLLNASENSRGELRWLIEGSEEGVRDRLNTIRKIQEEKGPVVRAST